MKAPARHRRSFSQIFAIPLLLAFSTLFGLVIGLTGEGARDFLSWLLLLLPLTAFAAAWVRRGNIHSK